MSMEPIVQLSGKYSEELAATFEGLRQRSSASVNAAQEQLHALQEQAEHLKQASPEQLAGVLQDFVGSTAFRLHHLVQAPTEIPTPKVLETFGWLSVMHLASGIVAPLSGYILSPLIGLFLEPFTLFLLAYGAVPALVYRQVSTAEAESDQHFALLCGAVSEGVLVGSLLANRYLSSAQPLAVLTPLVISLVAQLGEGKFSSREAFLGATLGGGVFVHLVLGLLFGTLSLPYLLLAVLYAGAGFVTLQFLLKDPQASSALYQLSFFSACVLSQGLVFALFGGAAPSNN